MPGRIDQWRTFVTSLSNSNATSAYRYPTTDMQVDEAIAVQDSRKRKLERDLIVSAARDCDWEIALDYGCGIGANFDCFDDRREPRRLLIGIDADPGRVEMAKESARELRSIKASVAVGKAYQLLARPAGLDIDLVVCIQVLGHLSSSDLEKTIQMLADVLCAGGKCVLAVPVVAERFKSHATAGEWDGRSDYLHWVHLDRPPNSSGFRETVDPRKFDKMETALSILPVRCFLVPNCPATARTENLPSDLPLPPTIEKLISGKFQVLKTQLYSIHMYDADGTTPLIGDAFMELIKT